MLSLRIYLLQSWRLSIDFTRQIRWNWSKNITLFDEWVGGGVLGCVVGLYSIMRGGEFKLITITVFATHNENPLCVVAKSPVGKNSPRKWTVARKPMDDVAWCRWRHACRRHWRWIVDGRRESYVQRFASGLEDRTPIVPAEPLNHHAIGDLFAVAHL